MTKNIATIVKELIASTVTELGYILWDVEFVREGAANILRVTIDTENVKDSLHNMMAESLEANAFRFAKVSSIDDDKYYRVIKRNKDV